MKRIGIRLFIILTVLFCSFRCTEVQTSFYITNASNQEIEIWSEHSYYGTYKCSLRHGESLKIAQDISSNLPKEFGEVINNRLEVSIGEKNSGLRRFWTLNDTDEKSPESALYNCNALYFKENGVRQLHDEKEWMVRDDNLIRVYTFLILPEDLIPLSDFIDKE